MANSKKISEESGKILLKLARQTISKKLGRLKKEDPGLDDAIEIPELKEKCGTFVTLTKNKDLRGCIGNLTAVASIVENVKQNALNSAFNDHRFSPLTEIELDEIDIEISILTKPEPLNHKDKNDLLETLRPHIDGVILKKGIYSATFLPQVWEQLPDKEDFLRHLSQKAGLPGNAWSDPDVEVLTYQVQYFEE
jgi:AmmeMemoRadiSam system protein A